MGLPAAGSSLPCTLLAMAVLAAAAGCTRASQSITETPDTDPELTWARQALERNPHLEVLASDPQTGVFTVRHRANGTIDTLSMDQLIVAPLGQIPATTPPLPSPEHIPDYAPEHTPVTEALQEPVQSTGSDRSESLAVVGADEHEATDDAPARTRHYTIERSSGQVRVSGPGISIVSAQPQDTTQTGAAARGSQDSPIICEGRRLLHLDDRRIVVDGDAIIARGGCELHITNSRIIASGTALVAHDAIVHITNSHVEGATGSFNAGERARIYLRASTLLGVPRRAEMAVVQDQGGNRWR